MASSGEQSNAPDPSNWGRYFRAALARRDRSRWVSYGLMGAMLVVILLGVQVVYVFDDPHRLALFLSLNFTFFFLVIFRATLECFDIIRKHIRDKEHLFQSVFCEDDFAKELGRRVRSDS